MADLPETPDSSSSVPESQPNVVNQAPKQTEAPITAPVLQEGYVHVYDMTGPQPQLGSMHDSEVTDSVASGAFGLPQGTPIPVVSPDGVKGTMDPSEAPEAFKNGWKYYTQADQDADNYGGPTDQAIAGAEGVAQGAFGPVATAVETQMGRDPEAMRKTAEQNPWAHGVGEAIGFLGPAAASMGATGLANLGVSGAADVAKAINTGSAYTQAGVASKAVEDAARLMGMGSEASTIAGKLAIAGIKTGTEMALFQAGDEATKAIQEDPNQSAATVAANLGTAALFGGALGVGASGVGQLWRAKFGSKVAESLSDMKDAADGVPSGSGDPNKPLNPTAAKILGAMTGTDEKFAQNYAANREALKDLPPDDDILDNAKQHVQNVLQNVSDTKEAATEAEGAFKELRNNAEQEFKQQGYDVKEAAKAASDTLNIAKKEISAQSLNTAMDAAKPVSQAVESLRQQGLDASSNAYDVLTKSGKNVSLDDMNSKAIDIVSQLKARRSPEADAMADKIQSYIERVNQGTNGVLVADKAKPVIQELDRLSKYNYNATEFDKGLSPYYKQLRGTLDGTLKTAVPAYAEAMKPTAEIFSKLDALKDYGTEESAQKAIAGLNKPVKYKQDMDMLRDLESRTKGNFIKDIDNYANPEIRSARIKAMPEYEANETAARMERAIKDPAYKQAVKDAYLNSPEYKQMIAAQAVRDKALSAKKDLGGITENNIAAKIRKGQIGNSQDILNLFAKFPNLADKGMPELIKLSGIRAGLEKAVGVGSKHVNMYGMLGMAATGGPQGGVLGMLSGSVIDKYGPKVAKFVIDKYLDTFGALRKVMGQSAVKEGAPDSLRAAVARVLDNDTGATVSGNQPNADGFKSMHGYISNLLQGNDLIKKSANNVFDKNSDSVLPKSAQASSSDVAKLEKNLQKFWKISDASDMAKHMDKTIGSLSTYMPDHTTAAGNLASNVANYLKAARPAPIKLGALDSTIPTDAASNAQWNRTLNIAQQPLTVLHNIRSGNITVKDIQDFRGMFPGLYTKVAQELTNSMMTHVSKGASVPYNTRIGLSLFLGQAMDSTMTPQGIMGAQPMPVPSPQQQTAQGSKSKGSPKSLSELPNAYRTPAQARQNEKQTKE